MADPDQPNIVTSQAAGQKYQVNRAYRPVFDAFLNELAATGYKIGSVQGYNNRNIAGTNTKSYHASGAAIDINPDQNPVNGSTNLPANISDIARKYGLGWGGDWTGGKKDPMHFSIASGEGGALDIPHLGEARAAPAAAAPSGATAVATAKPAAETDPDVLAGMALVHATSAAATDPDVAAGMALVHGTAPAAAPPADPDVAAGMALAKQFAAPAGPVGAAPPQAGIVVGFDAGGNPIPVQTDDVAAAQRDGPTLQPIVDAAGGIVDAAGRILQAGGQGAVAGYGDQPIIPTIPPNGGIMSLTNRMLVNPLLAGADVALRSGGALLGGYQGGITALGTEIGQPALGRDLAAMPEAFPTGLHGMPEVPTAGGALAEAPRSALVNPGSVLDVSALPHAPSAALVDDVIARLRAETQARNPLAGPPPAAANDALPITPQAAARMVPAAGNPLAGAPASATVDAGGAGGSAPTRTGPPGAALSGAPRSPIPFMQAPEVAPAPAAAAAEATPGMGPAPSAAGAAVTPAAAIPPMTQAQRLTNLEKSVTQSAEDRAGPQLHDPTVYVPDTERGRAAQEFSPANSLDDKTMRATDPVYRAAQEAIERHANQTMVDLLGKDAGDANAQLVAHEAREAVAPPAKQLFADEKPVDFAPVVARIDELLAGPDGKRTAVRTTLTDIRNSLHDANGDLETLPSQGYGARQNMTDILKRGTGSDATASAARASKAIVTQLLDQIDPIIDGGAPKYQKYLDEFHAASQPINQMDFLQQYQTGAKKLTNQDGYLELRKVQKMLDDIYQGNKAKGVNAAKSLTDAQIQNVINVRNELAANALRDRLAKVKGSDTTQQVNRAGVLGDGPLGTAVKGAAEMAGHALLFHTTGGLGNVALTVGKNIVKPARDAARAKKAADALAARKSYLLGTNPLVPPSAP